MMNVLHVNYSDIIGARFNGFYMLENNIDENIKFAMAVWKKKSRRNDVYELPPNNKFIKKIIWFLLHVLYKFGNDHLTSIVGYYLLSKTPYYKNADVIHLHIIHSDSNFSFKVIKKICKEKKVVWTFHDQWPISGGCVHPFDCKGVSQGCQCVCPYPRYKNAFFARRMPVVAYNIRKRFYEQCQFDIVVSTNWMREKVLSNGAVKNKNIHIIPFGLDINFFKARSKSESRSKFNIPHKDFVILIRNTGIYTDPMKGLRYAINGLLESNLYDNTTIITIDQKGGLDSLIGRFNIIELGWQDANGLVDVLSATDVFLMPSLQESFGLMSVEAMSCGVPVIVAEGTALPDVVKDGEGGIVVPARSSKDIAVALNRLNQDRLYLNKLSNLARDRARNVFNVRDTVNKHIEMYKKIL